MEKKNNKGVVISLLVVIAVLIGSITYMFISGTVTFNTKKNNDNKTEEKENNKNENDKENENQDEEQEPEENNSGESNGNIIKELNLNNCLNNNEYLYSHVTDISNDSMFSMKINSDQKSVTLSIDWEKFGQFSGASAWELRVIDYQVTGFSKNIINVFVGGVGQSVQGTVLFYLMEDGTVEYTPIFKWQYNKDGTMYYDMNDKYDISSDGKYSNQHFETEGAIEGVHRVIKLYSAAASYGISGWSTVLGALKDGSFYDLGEFIQMN